MSMASVCTCCGAFSFMGVVFFGITAIMILRENTVFLTHKAMLDVHHMTDEDINLTLWTTLYTLMVSHLLNEAYLLFCSANIDANSHFCVGYGCRILDMLHVRSCTFSQRC